MKYKIHKSFWDKLKTLRYLLLCDDLQGAELPHHLQALLASLLLQQKQPHLLGNTSFSAAKAVLAKGPRLTTVNRPFCFSIHTRTLNQCTAFAKLEQSSLYVLFTKDIKQWKEALSQAFSTISLPPRCPCYSLRWILGTRRPSRGGGLLSRASSQAASVFCCRGSTDRGGCKRRGNSRLE